MYETMTVDAEMVDERAPTMTRLRAPAAGLLEFSILMEEQYEKPGVP